MSQDKWDKRYLKMAALVAKWSKDPNAGVGAVVVRKNRVVATGFNGFPSEVLDNQERLANKEEKLQMVVHAEENALLVAGRNAEDATIYVYGKPVCPRCAGSIIQAGIERVVAMDPDEGREGSEWRKRGRIALNMFAEAGVQFHGKVERSCKDSSVTDLKFARESEKVNGGGERAAAASAKPARATTKKRVSKRKGSGRGKTTSA